MRALLSHASALRYWREHFPLDAELARPHPISNAEAFAYLKNDLKSCVPETMWPEGKPLDVLVCDARNRGCSRDVSYHVWSTAIPSNAFYRVGDVLISSPEFVFLQMAGMLTVSQLAALGCELCGTYILQPRTKRLLAVPDDAPRRRFPLINIESLSSFLMNAKGARHMNKASRALRFVFEASRSPMETTMVLQLCLPAMLGGYGMPRPTMNPVIELDDIARKIAGRRWCEGDACWIGNKLDLEYNGAVHAGTQQMKSDAGRVIGLERMGWKVITVTSSQVFDIEQFEEVASQVARCIKHRIRSEIKGQTSERIQLHYELDQWLETRM